MRGLARGGLLAGALAAALSACAANPKQTAQSLDRHDREWKTRDCVSARRAAQRYDDKMLQRAAVGVAGNLVVPLAGTAAATALSVRQNRKREALNHRLRAACVSDPLKAKGRLARR